MAKDYSYWEKNKEYPTKRGVCEFCGQRDDLKLSFDRIRYICLNAHTCVLRWKKALDDKKAAYS